MALAINIALLVALEAVQSGTSVITSHLVRREDAIALDWEQDEDQAALDQPDKAGTNVSTAGLALNRTEAAGLPPGGWVKEAEAEEKAKRSGYGLKQAPEVYGIGDAPPMPDVTFEISCSSNPSFNGGPRNPYSLRAQVAFGGGSAGSGPDQLNMPASITFFKNALIVTDTDNHRIMRVMPGRRTGEVVYGDRHDYMGPLRRPKSVTLYRDIAFIADTGNHRIIMLKRSFWGWSALGAYGGRRLLRNPHAVDFFQSVMYIADTGNNRIVALRSGDTRGYPVLGGGRRRRLRSPTSIQFYRSQAYIADYSNHRIIRMTPGQSRGEIVFGGSGQGSAPDRLAYPTSVDVYKGMMYIADTGNRRVVVARPGVSSPETIIGGVDTGVEKQNLARPSSVDFQNGVMFIADAGNERIITILGYTPLDAEV